MTFGKRNRVDDIQSPPPDIPIENIEDSSDDYDDRVREIKIESGLESTAAKGKPLQSEITYIFEESEGKKSGEKKHGCVIIVCRFKSSYTRVHFHFFGNPVVLTNSKLKLLKVSQTRFASHYILLEMILQCKEALATTIVLNAWKDLVNNGDDKMKTMATMVASTISDE
ncbi:hypothetical protein ACFE04_006115 [Oxalis oulophora]